MCHLNKNKTIKAKRYDSESAFYHTLSIGNPVIITVDISSSDLKRIAVTSVSFETKAFVFGIIKHYSPIWWFVFFPLIKKALFLFFFKGTRIVSWLLFKCALTRWIKWHQYYKCIIVCIAINYVTFSGCFVKKLNRTSWTEQGLIFWHLDLSIYFYVSCLPLAQNLKRKFSTVEFCCCISS